MTHHQILWIIGIIVFCFTGLITILVMSILGPPPPDQEPVDEIDWENWPGVKPPDPWPEPPSRQPIQPYERFTDADIWRAKAERFERLQKSTNAEKTEENRG